MVFFIDWINMDHHKTLGPVPIIHPAPVRVVQVHVAAPESSKTKKNPTFSYFVLGCCQPTSKSQRQITMQTWTEPPGGWWEMDSPKLFVPPCRLFGTSHMLCWWLSGFKLSKIFANLRASSQIASRQRTIQTWTRKAGHFKHSEQKKKSSVHPTKIAPNWELKVIQENSMWVKKNVNFGQKPALSTCLAHWQAAWPGIVHRKYSWNMKPNQFPMKLPMKHGIVHDVVLVLVLFMMLCPWKWWINTWSSDCLNGTWLPQFRGVATTPTCSWSIARDEMRSEPYNRWKWGCGWNTQDYVFGCIVACYNIYIYIYCIYVYTYI